MCGIIGIIGNKKAKVLVKAGMEVLKNRGRDGKGIYNDDSKNLSIGHVLHSVVGRVKQPFKEDNDTFIANCEIYNWKKLNNVYGFNTKNDAETLFRLIRKKGVSDDTLKLLDGVYAFAFLSKDRLIIARDIIGEKPVWYCHSDGFYFASEKKALEKMGCLSIQELNPRKIIEYDIKKDRMKLVERDFFKLDETKENAKAIEKELEKKLFKAVEKRISDRKFGLLFSGGIDSTMIALILKKMGKSFTCYTTVIDDPALKKPEDLVYAKKIAKDLDLDLKIIKIKPKEIKGYLKTIVPLIEDSNVVKVEVGLTFFAACKRAKADGCKVLFSGLGSEEIFAGYQRHRESSDINKECVSGLLKLYERDLYRDDVITMYNSIEARLPFLDLDLVGYALKIPQRYKIKEGVEKYILRRVALNLKLPEKYAMRKKKAAQYGSKMNKAISKLTKKSGFRYKSEFLRTFYPGHDLRLGALVSSGKDSIYAMHVMMRQNYGIGCMITIKSENPDSYMFHTPTIDLVKLQSKSTGIPLLIGSTKGEKEKELKDLKKIIKDAKEKYKLDGIITGALYSTYQRDRIEKICDGLSLKIFSPLWHMNQETEMKEILREGYSFIFTKIAAEGLDKSWIGREINLKDIDDLAKLNNSIGLNVAGEGGEFESLMTDGPVFSKKIEIIDSEIDEESENTATLVIKKSGLIKK